MRISDKEIKCLSTPEKGNKIYYDDEVKGFGVRVTSTGTVSFILNYRIYGRERRFTIGAITDYTSEAARDEAIELRKYIRKGIDPLDEKQKIREAPTVDELKDDYLEKWAQVHKRESSQKKDEELLNKWIIPKLGKLKVETVSYQDIERLHRSMKHIPYSANRVLALLHKMYALAIKWGWCEKNPVTGVQRYTEEKRERYLSADELQRLVQALKDYPAYISKDDSEEKINPRKEQSANIIRLLLLTGARRGEVISAKWDQFDLINGIWTKPSAHTKQKKIHRVPLSAPAMAMLKDIEDKGHDSDYVFPGTTSDTHQSEVKNAWSSICKLAKITDLRVHDLRHSYAAHLASAGLSLPIIGALLGHSQPTTTARYAHLLDDPLREATAIVGKLMEENTNES